MKKINFREKISEPEKYFQKIQKYFNARKKNFKKIPEFRRMFRKKEMFRKK